MGLLRILLALAVCFTHTTSILFPWMSGGAAVYTFFVISGFYIQMVLSERYTPMAMGGRWVRNFYLARYLRLFPAYALALLCVLSYDVWVLVSTHIRIRPFDAFATLIQHGGVRGHLYEAVLLFSNLTMLGLNLPRSNDLLITPAWSLGVEMSFYLIAPFILKRSDRALIAFVAVGLILRFLPFGHHSPLFAGMECFALGAFAYRYRNALITKHREILVLPFLLVAIGLPRWAFIPIANTHTDFDVLVCPLLVAVLIPTLYKASSRSKVDRFIGDLSYPFYIFHEFVITVLARNFQGKPLAIRVAIVTLIVALAVTLIERYWIEPRRIGLVSRDSPLHGINSVST